ncbi:MAG: SagB/ThcOx family dehydrogenase [Acidobacteriota bacterium]|nr:SagB/ThcOx family dehydrogenase [Acidobacteriota bacterium]
MIIPFDDGESLSRLFHINSEPWANVEAYREAQDYEVQYKEMAGIGEPVSLPAPGDSPLLELLSARESCRKYQLRSMSLETVSTILKCAYGITRTSQMPKVGGGYFRTVPSAGGLFPLEVYALAREIDGITDGIYHYNLRHHSLELLREGRWFAEFDKVLISAPFILNANLIFFLGAVFKRTQKKYGPRGYRYILLEAGHLAQNLCLVAAEQKLGSLCMGGYTDSRLNRFLGFDGISEAVVYSVAVGYPG